MSSAASDEETEELVAALNDDAELQDLPDDDNDDDVYESEQDGSSSEAASPRRHSEDTEEDDDDELHIAARAGIRLLEENMHFREEVLRLREQLTHVKDENAAAERSLADRDAQVAALSGHLREAILENQSVLSELGQLKGQLRASQDQVLSLQQQLQQRSPRRRTSNQRLSPRRSATFSRPLAFDDVDPSVASHAGDATPPPSPLLRLAPANTQSPVSSTATTNAEGGCISPSKPSETTTTTPPDETDTTGTLERRLSYGEGATSPRRRPTLARLREIEAKYDDAHQKCSSLKLELNFAQRRVSELKPLQGQLEQAGHELEAARSRLVELETQLAHSQRDDAEEQALIQSLRQTILVYEQLNDPRYRSASGDHHASGRRRLDVTFQEGGATTAETVDSNSNTRDENNNSTPPTNVPHDHNQQFARLDRAAEMIDGRFDLRDVNERLLQQLNALTERVLQLTDATIETNDHGHERAVSTLERRASLSKQRYLEQQVSVLQELLRRFRLEWQHAHDARVCLEDEKAELLKQIERQRATLQRTRSASVSSSRRASVESQSQSQRPPTAPSTPVDIKASGSFQPEDKDHDDHDHDHTNENEDDANDDDDEAHAQRLWEHTNAICEALLQPSPTSSREEDVENELLCFALLRRLVDSWTTDKPKRMQLHDWLTTAIRGTGVTRALYLHELSSEIAMGFQTLMVPILREKFGVCVHVEKRLRNVIVTDLRIQVQPWPNDTPVPAPRPASSGAVQRVYHSLLSVIDGEHDGGGDEYEDWLGNYAARRASRGYLTKAS